MTYDEAGLLLGPELCDRVAEQAAARTFTDDQLVRLVELFLRAPEISAAATSAAA